MSNILFFFLNVFAFFFIDKYKMIKSQRSKRRKLKHELNYTSQSLFNNASKLEENSNSVPCNLTIDTESTSYPTTSKDTIIELSKITTSDTIYMPINYENLNENIPSENAKLFSNQINSYVNSTSIEFSIRNFLSHWATKYNITHVALNGLLKGLKSHVCFNDFPVDSRTLLVLQKMSAIISVM